MEEHRVECAPICELHRGTEDPLLWVEGAPGGVFFRDDAAVGKMCERGMIGGKPCGDDAVATAQ